MDTARAHILIVEDSEDDQMIYAYFLIRQGYRVSEACDGREGIEKALRLKPDLVLLDLWLPRLSGWELIHALKTHEDTKHIPVVVVTGHSQVPSQEYDSFLTKPCSLDELGAEISRQLNPPPRTAPQNQIQ
jgi:DNA-binding response OmpR family regulator